MGFFFCLVICSCVFSPRRVISVWLSIQVDFFFCLVIDSSGLFLLFSYRFKWAFSSVWLSVHVFFPLSFGYRFMCFFASSSSSLKKNQFMLVIDSSSPHPPPPPFFSICLVIESCRVFSSFFLLFSYQFMQCFVLSCGDCGVC